MFELSAHDERILLSICSRFLTNQTVYAYGSRVKGTARPFSDIDLVVKGEAVDLEPLKEALALSDLTISVDISYFASLDKTFQALIAPDLELFYP